MNEVEYGMAARDYSRAARRHHEQRMKARFYRKTGRDELRTPERAGRYANHGCDCSCAMCGNPRRHFGERTVQERRFASVTPHQAAKGLYDGDEDRPETWHELNGDAL